MTASACLAAPGPAAGAVASGEPDRLEAAAPPQSGAQPTTAEFINAANWTYARDADAFPADLRPFEVDGQHLAREVTEDGFYGAAFVTPADQVIVAFEGTYLSGLEAQPEFVLAQVAADALIHRGQAPGAYADALAFAQTALAAAAARGIGEEAVFITGHSLGGAEALYVAAGLGLAGQTYGAPGIPAADIPADRASALVNYVERGDPVGNYSADPDVLNGFLFSDGILRYGPPTYLGQQQEADQLEAAGRLFGPGTTFGDNLEGYALLGGLADAYHKLTAYAESLGVTLDNPGGDAGYPSALLAAALVELAVPGDAAADPGAVLAAALAGRAATAAEPAIA